MSYVTLKYMPEPKKEYVQNFSNFTGGINIWEPDYGLKLNESPEMKNLLWRNGLLRSRKGQEAIIDSLSGMVYAVYSKPWHGMVFAHVNDGIYYYDQLSRSATLLVNQIPLVGGTFFVFDSKLYYKTNGAYKVITATQSGNTWTFTAATVSGYVPVTIINASPTNGSGDL